MNCIWKIKVIKYNLASFNIYFGVDSSIYPYYYKNSGFTNNEPDPNYSFGSSGTIYLWQDTLSGDQYAVKWKENDEIKMALNAKEKH